MVAQKTTSLRYQQKADNEPNSQLFVNLISVLRTYADLTEGSRKYSVIKNGALIIL